MSTTLIVRLHM